jgi:hypothetical protein
MTPRQKKRQMRASAKNRPLVFIRFRTLRNRISEATSRAMIDYMEGSKSAAEAMRDHLKRELVDIVLRPFVRRLVMDMAGVFA